jgi:hypothetical protein
MTGYYLVNSPVLMGAYLQGEIITAQEVGNESQLDKYLIRGALRELSSEEKENIEARYRTFVLPARTTPQDYVQWLWSIADRHMVPPDVSAKREGYYRVASPKTNFEGFDTDVADSSPHEVAVPVDLIFYLLPLEDGRLKVQMRRGPEISEDLDGIYTFTTTFFAGPPPQSGRSFSAYVVAEMYVRWPDLQEGTIEQVKLAPDAEPVDASATQQASSTDQVQNGRVTELYFATIYEGVIQAAIDRGELSDVELDRLEQLRKCFDRRRNQSFEDAAIECGASPSTLQDAQRDFEKRCFLKRKPKRQLRW